MIVIESSDFIIKTTARKSYICYDVMKIKLIIMGRVLRINK